MSKSKLNIFLILCAYNESKNLSGVVDGLKKYGHSIVVVDDCSTDKTFQISSTKADYSLRHTVNLGKGAAMKTGAEFSFAQGADAVIFIDADGQHDPKDVPAFVKALNEQNDVVFGCRQFDKNVPLVRRLGNRFACLFVRALFNIQISDLLCGFRGVSKKAYKKLVWESTGYGVETEMVIKTAKNNLKYCEIPVSTIYLDDVKGVTLLDAFNVFFEVLFWKFKS